MPSSGTVLNRCVNLDIELSTCFDRAKSKYLFIYLFSDFVQSTSYIKQKDTSPLQGLSSVR